MRIRDRYTLGGPANATKATACASMLTKIDTALTAAGDTDGLAFAKSGCGLGKK
jgi:hypothetical protein